MKTLLRLLFLNLLCCQPLLAADSLQSAIEQAQQRYPGRVISAETVQDNGNSHHQVRILGEDGRIHRIQLPNNRSSDSPPNKNRR